MSPVRASLAVATALALAVPAAAAAQPVPASDFEDPMVRESLETWVAGRLESFGRAAENEEIMATFRAQRERGLITGEQYAEAVAAWGGGPLLRDGRPFTGTVVGDGEPGRAPRVEAEVEDGHPVRVTYRRGDGTPVREVVLADGRITETVYWGGPYGDAPRSVTVYEGRYLGDATTRVTAPDGSLVQETTPDGGLRHGPGWMGDLNMWDADNAFYDRVAACDPAKLYVGGSYFEVLGPRAGGCGVRYGHWSSPDPARPDLAGESMVCVHRAGSAYDFIEALHQQGTPNDECEGGLAELLGAATPSDEAKNGGGTS